MTLSSEQHRIQFLHRVGKSTLCQGITIPIESQRSWLASIRKGQSIPVQICFGQKQSVSAFLRRLNNARGHLQFRYENKDQKDLREFLANTFGELSSFQDCLLEVSETSNRSFLFRPIGGISQACTTLALYQPYYHNISKKESHSMTELLELFHCIRTTPFRNNFTQKDYNSDIADRLCKLAWNKEVRIIEEIGLRCDFEKGGVWVEIEFGNVRTYYQDYVKFMLAAKYRQSHCGVLLCPTDSLAQLLCEIGRERAVRESSRERIRPPVYSGMMTYEKAIREIQFIRDIFTNEMIIAGMNIGAHE
jgi:hypothetical protein